MDYYFDLRQSLIYHFHMGRLKRLWPWLACAATVFSISGNSFASSLKITTFNLRWYGLGGEISGQRSDEYRDPFITEFLSTKYINTDIFLFQEVIDTERLGQLMNGLGHHCVSYRHEQFNHQHLMICLKKSLDIVPEKGDDDYTYPLIENRPYLRPALYGQVIDRYSKKPLIHLVGLHLKAGPSSIDARLEQVNNLNKRVLEYRQNNLPVVIAGDLNTYRNSRYEDKESDLVVLGDAFKSIDVTRRTSDYDYTYRNGGSGNVFDHFYVSDKTETKYVEIWRACGGSSRNTKRLENLSWYQRFISDHCPVSLRVDIQ